MLHPPDLRRKSLTSDLGTGLFLPFQAFGAVFTEGSLFFLAAVSATVTLAALAGLTYFVFHVSPMDLFSQPTSWYAKAAYGFMRFFLGVVIFAVGALTLPLLATVPLQDTISKRTEKLLGGDIAQASLGRMAREVSNSMAHTFGRVLILYTGHLLLLLLMLIPVVGQIAWTVLSWLWSVWWLSGEYLDIPMGRHLYRFADVRSVLRARPALCLSFGAVLYVFLFVPVLNFFIIPVAVIAGTMLFRGLVNAGVVSPPVSST